jgi:hypothetical protein
MAGPFRVVVPEHMRIRLKRAYVRALLMLFPLLLLGMRSCVFGSVLSSPNFVIRYDSLDAGLAREVADRAEKSFTQLTSQLQHVPETKILVVIASTEETFLENVRQKVPEWGLAFAFGSQGKIILKSPRLVKKNIDVNAVITHEVSHIMLHSFLEGRKIPLWLDEGFAMYQSKEWQIGKSAVVGWAAVTRRLYSLDQLETSFPWSDDGANLAYAESFLAVSYIIQEFGKEGLMGLLADLKSGMDIEKAMRGRFGFGYKSFKRDWMTYTTGRFSILSFMLNPLTVWPIVIVLLVVVYIKKRRRREKQLIDDTEYDAVVESAWLDTNDDV